jgi:hypothetical protein
MTKFIIGVVVGILLGATGSAYGAGASRSGAPSYWAAPTVANRPSFLTDRHLRQDIDVTEGRRRTERDRAFRHQQFQNHPWNVSAASARM